MVKKVASHPIELQKLNNTPQKESPSQQNKPDSNQTHGINPQVEQARNEVEIDGFNLPMERQETIKLNENMDSVEQASCKTVKKDSDYLKFFKYYYEKIHSEHPSWTPIQITTIISLQWKKKKMIDKQPASQPSQTSRRSTKPLTGKQAFRMQHKDTDKEEVEMMWNKLPKESKAFWKREGEGAVGSRLSEVSSVRTHRVELPLYNPMRMLLNQI